MAEKTKVGKQVKMYRDDPFFTRCCSVIDIQPTKRQFKKYIDGKGRAFTEGRPICKYADDNKISDPQAKEVLNG